MPSPAPSGYPIVTANDHGAFVLIATLFLMTAFIIAVFIRIVIRLAITRYLGRDDYIVIGATVRHMPQNMLATANRRSAGSRYGPVHCSAERCPQWPGEEGRYTQQRTGSER
jgi:hypothetical protein